MKKFKFYILCFFIFSLLGWLWEVIFNLVRVGEFINSGTLVGPWLPIYGWSGVIIVFISEKIKKNPLLIYITSFILFGVIEYGTSFYLEKVHHLKWWDYSENFLNINGRIWIIGLLFYALIGLIIVYSVVPIIKKIYNRINPKTLSYILIILISIHIVDFVYSTLNPERGAAKHTKISINYNLKTM